MSAAVRGKALFSGSFDFCNTIGGKAETPLKSKAPSLAHLSERVFELHQTVTMPADKAPEMQTDIYAFDLAQVTGEEIRT